MPKAKTESVALALTPAIARKLAKHQNVIIKPSMIGSGVTVHLSGAKHRKLMTAHRKNKGMRLSLSPEEIEMSGEGFKDLLKRGAKAVAHHVVKHVKPHAKKQLTKILEKPLGKELASQVAEKATDYGSEKVTKAIGGELPRGTHLSGTDKNIDDRGGKIRLKDVGKTISRTYKKYVKPIASPLIRKGLQEAVSVGTKALGTYLGPEASPIVDQISSKYGEKAVDYAMKKTGLGMTTGGAFRLQSNYSNFLNTAHPAMTPTMPLPDNSLPRYTRGGSFLPAGFSRGGSFMPAGRARHGYGIGAVGTALNPLLPQRDFSLPY